MSTLKWLTPHPFHFFNPSDTQHLKSNRGGPMLWSRIYLDYAHSTDRWGPRRQSDSVHNVLC